MEEIRRRDWLVFFQAFLRGGPLFLLLVGLFLFLLGLSAPDFVPGKSQWIVTGVLLFLGSIPTAYVKSVRRRFHNERFQELWDECVDRKQRLHSALQTMRKKKLADFQELPRTVDALAKDIYMALRRADVIEQELLRSEGQHRKPSSNPNHYVADPQAQELFRIADRNLAEYNQAIKVVTNSLARTEGQAAVFITTLDSLRARILNYRLAGRSPETNNQEFLIMVTEAKMQFEAIDKALDELELTPFPTQITVLPPLPYQHLRESAEPPEEDENQENKA